MTWNRQTERRQTRRPFYKTLTLTVCELNKYLLQGGRSIQLLRAQDFKPTHRVWGRASTGSKASGIGDKSLKVQNIYQTNTKFGYL